MRWGNTGFFFRGDLWEFRAKMRCSFIVYGFACVTLKQARGRDGWTKVYECWIDDWREMANKDSWVFLNTDPSRVVKVTL